MFENPVVVRLVSLARTLALSWGVLVGPAAQRAAAQNDVAGELAVGIIEGEVTVEGITGLAGFAWD